MAQRQIAIGFARQLRHIANAMRTYLTGIAISVACLCAYLIGGEHLLLVAAILLPLVGFLAIQSTGNPAAHSEAVDGLTGLRTLQHLEKTAQTWLNELPTNHRKTACFFIGIDNYSALLSQYGETACLQAQRTIAQRIIRGLRDNDVLARTGESEFMFVMTPVRHLDLEICVQLAARLKAGIESALPVDATTIRVTASIGFCRSDQIDSTAFSDLAAASKTAFRDARTNGASTLRAFSPAMQSKENTTRKLSSDAARALGNDEIRAWFQPQVSTDTGAITGFEALARWDHPKRGIVSPAGFLEVLAETGQLERLADLMLNRALEAQKTWEENGFSVPHVGVNFAGEELRNPMLVEKIHWELDRFDLSPNRIAIEVLETVIADAGDGAISRNVNGLANLGCYIDLDDFGTGHASISSIRRFSVSRLKIDRSFVMHIDSDPEQQRLVAAIVTMADRLGLETLAEGVETQAEHAMLTDLGCTHVQGFGIARPMPFEQTIPWMRSYLENLAPSPQISGKNLG